MPARGSKKAAATPARTPSRGRKAAAPAVKGSPVKSPEVVPVFDMAFTESDQVMAKWPGTNLFFKAKVTFVRDDDNEYDVQVSGRRIKT